MELFTIFANAFNAAVAVPNRDPASTRPHMIDAATGDELRPAGEVCAMNECDALDLHYRSM